MRKVELVQLGKLARGGEAARSAGPTGNPAEEADNSKTCVFPKRTHRFLFGNSFYHARGKILPGLQGDVWGWFRFRKRTHREGILRGRWVKFGCDLGEKLGSGEEANTPHP